MSCVLLAIESFFHVTKGNRDVNTESRSCHKNAGGIYCTAKKTRPLPEFHALITWQVAEIDYSTLYVVIFALSAAPGSPLPSGRGAERK
jgi:hypothetical protein